MDNSIKKWWASRTVWAALISFVAVVAAEATGWQLDPKTQAAILSGVMIVMRLITRAPVSL